MRVPAACYAVWLLGASCTPVDGAEDEVVEIELDVYDAKSDYLFTKHITYKPTEYHNGLMNQTSTVFPMTAWVHDVKPDSFAVDGTIIQLGVGQNMTTRLTIQGDRWDDNATTDNIFMLMMKDAEQTRGAWLPAMASNGQIRSAVWRSAEIDPNATVSWAPTGFPKGVLNGSDYNELEYKGLSFPVYAKPEYAIFTFPAWQYNGVEGQTLRSTISVSR